MKQRLAKLTFRDLVTSDEGRVITTEVIRALMSSISADRSAVWIMQRILI